MDEVNRYAVDLRAELWELVHLRLLCAPVETVLPVGHQFAQRGAIDSVGPVLIIKFGGPARVGQAHSKRIYLTLRHIDCEWFNLHCYLVFEHSQMLWLLLCGFEMRATCGATAVGTVYSTTMTQVS